MECPRLSIVIGTFNQKDVLKKVLDSFNVQSASPKDYEVIVVDSSSSDGTDYLLKSHNPRHGFQCLVQPNKGKTAARNKAIALAKSSVILVTDADMIADSNLVQSHIDAHENAKVPSCFEGLTYNLKTLEWPTNTENTVPYITPKYPHLKKLGWFYFLTGNVSFPKQLFLDNNGFSEEFQGYGWEDLELGYRLYKKKIPLFYLKFAINFHYHVVSKDEEILRNIKKGESAQIFLKLHPELKWFLGVNPLSVFISRAIKKEGRLFNLIKKKCYHSKNKHLKKIGFWFLKEYHYLSGILNKK